MVLVPAVVLVPLVLELLVLLVSYMVVRVVQLVYVVLELVPELVSAVPVRVVVLSIMWRGSTIVAGWGSSRALRSRGDHARGGG